MTSVETLNALSEVIDAEATKIKSEIHSLEDANAIIAEAEALTGEKMQSAEAIKHMAQVRVFRAGF